MNSYSQHGEDTRLMGFIDLVERRDGVTIPRLVVEAGASNGTTNSNSRMLIEQGWRAILIEPHPETYPTLAQLHHGNAKVHTVNMGLSDYPGPATTSLYLASEPGHSSLLPVAGARAVTVKTNNLCNIVMASPQYHGGIGILSLDIEGLEMKVLPDVLDLAPCILILEANTAGDRQAQRFLLRSGAVQYEEIACNSVNSIYYRADLINWDRRYALKWKCK